MPKFHPAGDKTCPSCYHGYPKPCHSAGCKGLQHAVRGDEPDDDEGIWLHTGCDVCDRRESVIPTNEGVEEVTVVGRILCEKPSRSIVMQGVS